MGPPTLPLSLAVTPVLQAGLVCSIARLSSRTLGLVSLLLFLCSCLCV